MSKILVSGLINIETTLRIEGFPISYSPVRYPFSGVHSSVSGVGYNIARALKILGDEVSLLSLSGKDALGDFVRDALTRDGLSGEHVLAVLDETAQSVILYDGEGRRQINVDLKDVQETPYPTPRYKKAAQGCDWTVLCNINFSRPFLELARRGKRRIATDVHAITNLEDPYNADFMRAADVLFMSYEWLSISPEDWAEKVWKRYNPEVLVISMGADGALLAQKRKNQMIHVPAVTTRPIVNTIGAGDALFASFLHTYIQTQDALLALRKGMVFASYKIGAAAASDGFLTEAELDVWMQRVYEQA